eukprot:scaffold72782_cov14-Tisochrysis_lutea.AAC.1
MPGGRWQLGMGNPVPVRRRPARVKDCVYCAGLVVGAAAGGLHGPLNSGFSMTLRLMVYRKVYPVDVHMNMQGT